jgi:hypothetical protein
MLALRASRANADATSTSDNRLVAAGSPSSFRTEVLPVSRTYRLTRALASK